MFPCVTKVICESFPPRAINLHATPTASAVDQGEKPAVISAIAKAYLSETMRKVVCDAMDIIGGAGVCRGPRAGRMPSKAGAGYSRRHDAMDRCALSRAVPGAAVVLSWMGQVRTGWAGLPAKRLQLP